MHCDPFVYSAREEIFRQEQVPIKQTPAISSCLEAKLVTQLADVSHMLRELVELPSASQRRMPLQARMINKAERNEEKKKSQS